VRRDAVFELEKRSQPSEPFVAEQFDVDPRIGTGNRCAKRRDHNVEQIMLPRPLDARIGKIFKRRENGNQTLRHRQTLREIQCSTKESKQSPCFFQAARNTAERLDAIAVGEQPESRLQAKSF
jgi:hypothetical protein